MIGTRKLSPVERVERPDDDAHKQAGQAAERARDDPREINDDPRAYPAVPGKLGIGGRGAHCLAELRPFRHRMNGEHDYAGHYDNEHLGGGEANAFDPHGWLAELAVAEETGSSRYQYHVVQDQRDRQAQDDQREHSRAASLERPEHTAVHGQRQRCAGRGRDQSRHPKAGTGGVHRVGDERRCGHDASVGDVQHIRHAELEGEPDACDGEERSGDQTAAHDQHELIHASDPLWPSTRLRASQLTAFRAGHRAALISPAVRTARSRTGCA